MASKSKVYFFFNKVNIPLRNRTNLKRQIQSLFKEEGKKLERLNYVFCSDQKLLKMNQQYLGHDYFTDIISFDLSENKNSIIGEIYISLDRVKDNSRQTKESINRELRRVIFHGALHLCGYKDKRKKEKKEMREKEDYYLDILVE